MRNFFTTFKSVFYVKANRIFDIYQNVFVSITMCVATLKFRTKGKIALVVLFDNHRKFIYTHLSTSHKHQNGTLFPAVLHSFSIMPWIVNPF